MIQQNYSYGFTAFYHTITLKFKQLIKSFYTVTIYFIQYMYSFVNLNLAMDMVKKAPWTFSAWVVGISSAGGFKLSNKLKQYPSS